MDNKVLTPTKKYLQPHSIFGNKTFDEYCAKIPEFYFKKGVPEDVIKNFEIIEKLLALSYYEYKFIDEAYAKAIHSFEMAMSIRYKDFYSDTKKHGFNTLITKLSQLNLFETSIEILKHVRNIRNSYSHPDRHSFGGMALWDRAEPISRLINEMYEDVELRLKRKEMTEQFKHQIKKNNLDKFLVMEIQGKKTILYSMRLLFINNKRVPHTCLLACTPLFNLQQDDDSIIIPCLFKSKLSNPTFINDTLTGESFVAKQKVTFSPIRVHQELLVQFGEWNSEYENKKNKVHYEFSSDIYISEIFIPEIQEFQKM